jgi:hypothetical protein
MQLLSVVVVAELIERLVLKKNRRALTINTWIHFFPISQHAGEGGSDIATHVGSATVHLVVDGGVDRVTQRRPNRAAVRLSLCFVCEHIVLASVCILQ